MAESIKRRRSKTLVKDQDIIHAASMFRQWGFMDYIAARELLTRALETIKEPIPTRARDINELAKKNAITQQTEIAKSLEVGHLLLPACALAATSVEKYFKAIVTLKDKKKPKNSHLDKGLINSVKNAVKGVFSGINKDFIGYLRECYELRYFDKMQRKTTFLISPRLTLSELDFTIAEMEKTIRITPNGFEIPDSYQSFSQLKVPALWQHNYLLLGTDKTEFLKGQDFSLSIISDPTTGRITMAWYPSNNTGIEDQFFAKALYAMAGEADKTVTNFSEAVPDLEATIMHYFFEQKEKTGERH